MTVEGTITEQEFARLNWTLFYRRPAIALLLLAVLGVGLFFSTRSNLGDAALLLSFAPLLVPCGLFFMVTHNARRKHRCSQLLRTAVRYQLLPEGVEIASADARAILPWDQLASWQDLPRHLLLYSSKGQAFVVGKAWFGDHAALTRFTTALDQRTPPPESAAASETS